MTDTTKTDASDAAKARGRFTAFLQTFRTAQAALAECSESSPEGAHDSPAVLYHEGQIAAFANAEDSAALALLTAPAMDIEQLTEKLLIFALFTDPINGALAFDRDVRKSMMDDVERLLRAPERQQDLAA